MAATIRSLFKEYYLWNYFPIPSCGYEPIRSRAILPTKQSNDTCVNDDTLHTPMNRTVVVPDKEFTYQVNHSSRWIKLCLLHCCPNPHILIYIYICILYFAGNIPLEKRYHACMFSIRNTKTAFSLVCLVLLWRKTQPPWMSKLDFSKIFSVAKIDGLYNAISH